MRLFRQEKGQWAEGEVTGVDKTTGAQLVRFDGDSEAAAATPVEELGVRVHGPVAKEGGLRVGQRVRKKDENGRATGRYGTVRGFRWQVEVSAVGFKASKVGEWGLLSRDRWFEFKRGQSTLRWWNRKEEADAGEEPQPNRIVNFESIKRHRRRQGAHRHVVTSEEGVLPDAEG